MILITYVKRETHYFHFHHYTAALLGLPLMWIPHGYTIFWSGFSNGVLVEGTARWGYDPWWIPHPKDRLTSPNTI